MAADTEAAGETGAFEEPGEAPDGSAAAVALIEAGAYVNAVCRAEPMGFTPLHRCVAMGPGRLAVARRLVEAGADRTAFDPVTNRTPYELAVDLHASGETGMADYLALLEA